MTTRLSASRLLRFRIGFYLPWIPVWVAHEQAIDERNPVDQEGSEGEARQGGCLRERTVEPHQSPGCVRKGHADGGCDQHHADNRADAEHREIDEAPHGVAD